MLNLANKTWVAYIPHTAWTKGKGHRVHFVIEGEDCMRPNGDTPEGGSTEPWYWGDPNSATKSYELAVKMAEEYNLELGISKERADDIVMNSMIAGMRKRR